MVFCLIQIYVEIERARLTRILASIREGQGNITEAANVLQELQVCHLYHVLGVLNNAWILWYRTSLQYESLEQDNGTGEWNWVISVRFFSDWHAKIQCFVFNAGWGIKYSCEILFVLPLCVNILKDCYDNDDVSI